MYEIRLRPEAERDIEDAAVWYENQREGLTERQKVNFLWCGLPACSRYTAGKMPAPQ